VGVVVDSRLPLRLDAKLAGEMAAELKANVLNADGIRSFATRRVAVDVLEKMQVVEGYRTLRECRAELAAARATLTGDDQAYVDDLLARIDRALAPYFDL
jgi:hypothetical protein